MQQNSKQAERDHNAVITIAKDLSLNLRRSGAENRELSLPSRPSRDIAKLPILSLDPRQSSPSIGEPDTNVSYCVSGIPICE